MFSKRITQLSLALLVCIAIVFNACKSEQKLALKFAPEIAKKYEMSMTTIQDIEMEQMGQKMNMKNTVAMTYEMLVKEKDANNNIIIVSTFKKIKFVSNNPGGEMGYDSEKEVDTSNMFSMMFAQIFGSMINENIIIVVNESGEVSKVTGMAAIFDKMTRNTGLDSMPGAAESLASFKEQFSDDQFKKNFDESFNILPKTDIAIGETWNIENNKNVMSMDVNTKTKYTLKGMEPEVALVDVNAEFTIEKKAEENQGIEMTMKGTQVGTMKIDRKIGMATEGNISQDISATSKSMGMEIPMTIKGTITFSSKEIK